MDKATFFDHLRRFLGQADTTVDPSAITPQQHLFNTGVLDSFRVAELIAFIEGLKGERLVLDQMSLDSVSTMENIYEKFFGG